MAEVPEFRAEEDPMEVDSTFTKEREKAEDEEEQEDEKEQEDGEDEEQEDGEDEEQGDAEDGEQGDEEDEEGQDDENNEDFNRDGTFQCILHKSMVAYLLGFLIDQQFGPPVLLDAVFCQTTHKGYPRELKYFQRTWASLMETVDGADLGQQRYHENRKFTLRVLEALGGKEVSEYAESFLHKHPYWAWDPAAEPEDSEDSGTTEGSVDE